MKGVLKIGARGKKERKKKEQEQEQEQEEEAKKRADCEIQRNMLIRPSG